MTINSENWFRLDKEALRQIRTAAADVITQSEIMLRASCARKWFYRYVLRLGRRGFFDQNLFYGALTHKLLETLYISGDAYGRPPEDEPILATAEMIEEILGDVVLSPLDAEEVQLSVDKAQIAFAAYRQRYFKDDARLNILGVEKTYTLEWEDLRFCIKVDMVAKPRRREGVFIWDFKTARKLDAMALDAWSFRFQFLFYCWLFWKVTGRRPAGLMINGLVKTAMRPRIADRKTKRKEDREEYLARVRGAMHETPDDFFFRERIPLGAGALERFEAEMLMPHVQAFRALRRRGPTKAILDPISALAFAQNTHQCHVYGSNCEYLTLCRDGRLALSEYLEHGAKHEELDKI